MIRPTIDRLALERVLPHIVLVTYVSAVTFGTLVGGLWAAAGIGGGLVLFGATWIVDRRVPRPDPTVAAFVLALLASILLLDLGAVYPAVSWQRLWQEATILLPLAVLSSPRMQARIDDSRLWPIVAKAALVGACALGIEFLAGAPLLLAIKGNATGLTFYNRGISYVAVFSFPLLGFLWSSGRRWQAVLFVLVMAIPVEFTDSRATRAALILGLATTMLAFIAPFLVRVVLNLVFLALLLSPWAATFVFIHNQPWIRRLPPSWQHRVEIWDYMSYRIFDRPWRGWGIGSSRLLDYAEPHGSSYVWMAERAGHPHNGILQLWVELGIPGVVFGTAFALWLLWRCGRMPARLRPFAYGAWVAALCVSLVAYNFWDDSLFSLFALTMLSFRSLSRWTASAGCLPDIDGQFHARLAPGRGVPQIGRVAVDYP